MISYGIVDDCICDIVHVFQREYALNNSGVLVYTDNYNDQRENKIRSRRKF